MLMRKITGATKNGIRTQFSKVAEAAAAGMVLSSVAGSIDSKVTNSERPEASDSLRTVITTSSLELNFEQIMHTWRKRLPNKWDSASVWADTLTWRRHMYGLIARAFQGRIAPKQMSILHDSEWTMLKLAQVAHDQHLPEFAKNILNSSYTKSESGRTTGSTANSKAYLFQHLRETVQGMLQDP